MAIITLCPDCGTTFRVNAAQLQICSGNVRCGHCQRVFNGFATLITVSESEIEYPAQIIDHPQVTTDPEVSSEGDTRIANLNNKMELSFSSDRNKEEIEISDNVLDEEKLSNKTKYLWGIANIFLLLSLVGQIVHTYRTELTIIIPEIRPYLERYCAIISCIVPYPQDIKQLGIESSDLQQNLAQQPEVATLVATIRNHAPFPQALPSLQLSLLDVHERLIASRIFTAQDYLHKDNETLQFIESQHEIDIRLDFDSSHLDAMGYRLILLYP